MPQVTVTALMATTSSRAAFLSRALECFNSRVYPADWSADLSIDEHPTDTLGKKLNRMVTFAPAIRSADSVCRFADHAPRSLNMELSALRRNHAGCRAPLRRATHAPISASSEPRRRMNPHPQPRISLVLRRAHCFSVLRSSECNMVVRSRLSDAPPHDHSLCHQQLKPRRSDSNVNLANDQDRLIQIQTP